MSKQVNNEVKAAMKKLTKAQKAALQRLREAGEAGERTPFAGGREAGSIASGWYRTMQSLQRLGMVRIDREGDAQRAWIKN